MWKDLLLGSRLPEETGKELDREDWSELRQKYVTHKPLGSPKTLDDYLLIHLCSRASFFTDGKRYRDSMVTLIGMQKADGLLSCEPETDRIPATGLTVMLCTMGYQSANRFGPRIKDNQQLDQKIELEPNY